MKNIVRINIDDSMNDLELSIENRNVVNILNKNANKKGKNNIRHLYSWTKDNKIIKCYGWYDGNHDHVNKHELIPYGSSKFLEDDSSTILLYGDIYLLCYDNNNKILDFNVSDYANFYNEINEGFDDCDSDDDETDEEEYFDGKDNNEEEEDTEYKPDDEEEDEHDFEIINTSDSEELEEDKTEY